MIRTQHFYVATAAKIVNWVRYRNADVRSEWDIEIDVVNRILDPGEEGRKYNLRVVGGR